MALAKKLCKNCGKSFTPGHHLKQYCTDECKKTGKVSKPKPEADAPTKVKTSVLPSSDPAGRPPILESTKQTADHAAVNSVGVVPLTTMTDAPVEVDRRGGLIIMESRMTPVTVVRPQPLITQAEAETLGVLTWHRYSLDRHIFTCVVNGRRLMLTEATFQNMKDQGKAKQDG
jgi:hypothetical protein